MIHWVSSDCATTIEEDNQSSFSHYTELGWEASVGRLKVIRMIGEGKITKDDTIVTLKDRMFMYSRFCNVVPFEKVFNESEVGMYPSYSNYLKWIHELHVDPTLKKIVPWRWPQDMPMILNFDFEEVSPPPCVVINHRIRGWDKYRNCDPKSTKNIISIITTMGLKTYISGRHAESVDERAEHIPTLRKLSSIIHHPNCVAFISTGGTTMLAQQCCSNKLICLNTACPTCLGIGTCKECQYLDHPLYMSKALNFSGYQGHVVMPNDYAGIESLLKS